MSDIPSDEGGVIKEEEIPTEDVEEEQDFDIDEMEPDEEDVTDKQRSKEGDYG